jgi:peroxiredoxin
MASLRPGQPAPDFTAATHDGGQISLADFRGRHLVLFFYPRANTPVCTLETQSFRDHAGELESLGAAVVGVSTDDAATQCGFAERHGVAFPLITDEGGGLARSYGVRRGLLGVAKRVTFVIDPEGIVVGRFHHELSAERHVRDVLELLRSRTAS